MLLCVDESEGTLSGVVHLEFSVSMFWKLSFRQPSAIDALLDKEVCYFSPFSLSLSLSLSLCVQMYVFNWQSGKHYCIWYKCACTLLMPQCILVYGVLYHSLVG